MIFRTRKPSSPLRPFVDDLWYHEGLTTAHAMERLLPDGAIELIVDLTEGSKPWRDPLRSRETRTVRGSWVSGQHSRYIEICGAKDSCMIGARFRPGGLHPFLAAPVSHLNDAVVEAELVWGVTLRELRERLLAARGVEERMSILENWLLARAGTGLLPDPCLAHALERLRHRPGRTEIGALASECNLSHKQLVRRFEEKVGLKPKTLARILRFQTVLRKLEEESRVSWGFLAQDAGYYDQSHFIHDFETFSGLTPSRYLVEKGEYLNFVPLR